MSDIARARDAANLNAVDVSREADYRIEPNPPHQCCDGTNLERASDPRA